MMQEYRRVTAYRALVGLFFFLGLFFFFFKFFFYEAKPILSTRKTTPA